MNVTPENSLLEPTPKPNKAEKLLYLGQSALQAANLFAKTATTLKSNEAVRRFQLRQLQRLVRHAWETVPFYRSLWQNAGFNPDMLQSLADMQRIPIISKKDVLQNAPQMLSTRARRKMLSIVTTGGTTGMPLEFYINNYTARTKEIANQYYFELKVWHYRHWLDKCVAIRGTRIPEELINKGIFWVKSNRDRGLSFSSFHLTDENYSTYMAKLREYKPRFIRAYPSSIVALCQLMQRHGHHGLEGLKGVLCSSENVWPWQRKLVRETLGVDIYSQYGHTEKSVLAFEKNGLMLFMPRYGYTEFLNPEGKVTVTPGERALIVATGFGLDDFPFIRYNTSDYAIVGPEVEGFSVTSPQILGREQDFLVDRNGNHIPFTCADEVFWGITTINAYQYYQCRPGELTVRVQPAPGFTEAHRAKIAAEAQSIFINFDIKVVEVPEIPKTKSGKFRYLIQDLEL